MKSLCIAIAAALVACSALAADPARPGRKEMPMDEPMHGQMKKPGMKIGDVKKSAEKKRQRLKPMLEKEERSMEQGKGK
jgi:Spy/CpxP family protein refolding chaperone